MRSLLRDLGYGFRSFRRTPGFTAVVVLTLALGIGANTAIFSIVDAVLLRPLDFPQPQRLVRVVDNAPGVNLHDIGMAPAELRDLQERSGVFEDISAVWPVDANVTGAGRPERVELVAVSPNYFSLLGVHAQIGRVFGPQDKADGFAEAAIISYGFWQRNFGGDPHVLGRRIRLDGDGYTIVGVMPAGFHHPGRTLATDVDLWATAGFAADPFPTQLSHSNNFLPGAVARLKPGLTLAQAQAQLDSFVARMLAAYPDDYNPQAHFSLQLEPLQEALTGKVRSLLSTLLAAVAMMLLICCVNIANLLLARAAGRDREMAIRQSLGASRERLVRQMLTESLLLALAAGVVGVAAAALSLHALLALAPSRLPRLAEIGMDSRVLLFAVATCLATALVFGLAPALQSAAFDMSTRLKESGRGGGPGRRQSRASGALIAAEFAICLMLMTGAGLLVRSFWGLTHTDPGFNPQNAMVARIWLPQPNDPKQNPYAGAAARDVFVHAVLGRIAALPGVSSAAMSSSVPLAARGTPTRITVEGRAVRAEDPTLAEAISVTADYFRVLRTPVLEGRAVAETDGPREPFVALVDRTTARRYWPGESPLGKRIKLGGPRSSNPWATVVGIVGNIRHDGVDTDGVPHIYLSLYQRSGNVLALEIRALRDPSALGESLRREVQAVDPDLPVFGIASFNSLLAASLAEHRFSAQLMGAFAVIALLLAGVGIYGVLAYFVGQRTREIGVRIALGAATGRVVAMVLRQGLRPIALGMAAGVAGSLAFSRVLAGLLYGVSATDPIVLAAVSLFLLAAAGLAAAVPAWRATRVDPMTALRWE